ncbi:Cys-tRNA(Pro) deacylase [Campylobacter sp. RM12327]|uniref:Cys-tRNA(Pro) deacylase n=1 Tax=Campylobacter sputorum TaxID=206 RepID=UPI000B78F296|nr:MULTISPECIES: Cys-tRNA(Pro) deacylase [Campylobacter]ASM39360.1 aminoacyl-tRNA deacylase, YbaK family [Campylobacter sputorum]MBE7358788.1 Cys-tRNA(Pro) deacylase [Campylobacter sp. RM11302]MBF6670110.1 Cys-tRNA(Pro) deacylase [Campylobacter sp. RM12327]MBF6675205.1 Cys-tRNA(Pro) deacylase [Campylobacter sp. RM13538]MBF6676816.1 Cys-tRNA(Pro) deacylase [Campylobacter sp. RM12321]
MSLKTNAARILDNLNIDYEIKEYCVDENHLDAVHTASKTGISIEKVYKTIVCKADNEHIVACLQGDLSLNLKALAKIAGAKRCELINLKDITKITGYIRGGCSPLGMKKHFRTFIDEKILSQEQICVSAGIRGKQIYIKPNDLIKATNATLCDITQD